MKKAFKRQIVELLDRHRIMTIATDLLRVSDADLEDFIEARRHHWASFHAA